MRHRWLLEKIECYLHARASHCLGRHDYKHSIWCRTAKPALPVARRWRAAEQRFHRNHKW